MELLKGHGVLIGLAAFGKAEEDDHAKRFKNTNKNEERDLSEILDLRDAFAQIGRFL